MSTSSVVAVVAPKYRLIKRAASIAVLGTALVGSAANAAAAEPMAYGQGLLWKIVGAARTPSYVFGTIHLSDERVTDIPKPVRRALAKSRSLSVEMVIAPEDEDRVTKLMTYSGARTLERVIGEPLFAQAAKAVAPLGLGAQDIRRFKPWYVAALVGTHPDEAMRRSGGRAPLDSVLASLAERNGSRLYGLETFREHFALFNGLTERDQIDMLKHAVANTPTVHVYYERMVRSYLARDLDAMVAQVSEYNASLEPRLRQAFKEKLLLARNRTMARRMQRRLHEGGAFVAIGAAHLPGKGGVLWLLAHQGYRVERVY